MDLEKLLHNTMQISTLQGGSICQTQLLKTAKGNAYVYKKLDRTPKDFFIREKNGLETLAKHNIFKTPQVYAVTEDSILLEYIKPTITTNKSWHKLGEKLAKLHRITQAQYGFFENNFLALIAQTNDWSSNWSVFYREQRLIPLLKHSLFTTDDQNRWQRLLNRLDDLLADEEPPALIHGDLWNTNIIFTADDIYLIDPAVYYAPREIEIAYLEFVGNLYQPLLEAYQANYPLSKYYQERKQLYWLYPYLVHLHLFGESYLPGLRQILYYYT